jgi:hypothetical protein
MRGIPAAAIAVNLAIAGSGLPQPNGPPYSPQAALATFRLADGFQIELFAAEPLLSDPVAMDVDEYGRAYVVEMHGYPLDVAGSGRVMLLQDTDGDGRPDRSTVFADRFRLPNGIMRWKKGVLVTDAPDVWYLEDTDGASRRPPIRSRSGCREEARRQCRARASNRCACRVRRPCRKASNHRSACRRWRI